MAAVWPAGTLAIQKDIGPGWLTEDPALKVTVDPAATVAVTAPSLPGASW